MGSLLATHTASMLRHACRTCIRTNVGARATLSGVSASRSLSTQVVSQSTSNWRNYGAAASLVGAAGLYIGFSSPVYCETRGSLDPDEFTDVEIEKIEQISHDTKRFTFKLPEDQTLGMDVASLLVVKCPPKEGEKKPVIKPYTPVTKDTPGSFSLVIKRYDGGAATPFIHSLKEGDTLPMKGPYQKFKYHSNMKKEIGMIAGGTGITPMHQVISEITSKTDDETQVTLLYSNKTEKDTILREELDALENDFPNVHVVYKTSRATHSEGWVRIGAARDFSGRITKQDMKEYLPPPGDDTLILVCGPSGFYETYSGPKTKKGKQGELKGLLKELGYTEKQVFKF